jgi:hypothetical protein
MFSIALKGCHYHTIFGVVSHSHLYGSFFRIIHFNIVELSLRKFAELGEITIGSAAVIPVYTYFLSR